VLATILSRCQRFDFRRIPLQALEQHLAWIAEQEAIGITPEALHVVAQRAQGGLRDAESLLDQLSLLPPPVEAAAVWDLLGAVPEQELLELAKALGDAEALGLLETCRSLLERGREPTALLQGLASLLRDLVLAGVAPDRLELTSVSPQLREQLPALARRIGKARLLHWQAQLRGSEQQLRHSVNPRLWLEVLLLGLLDEATGASSMPAPAPAVAATVAAVVANPAPAQQEAAPTAAEAAHSVPAKPMAPATSLADLWAQILASLELPSTRMLLSQQARLVRLDDHRAVVQVAGTWMAMVQTRQALVEQAISRALGGTRQLTLEAAGDPPPVPNPPPPQLPQLAREPAPTRPAPGASASALPGPAATTATVAAPPAAPTTAAPKTPAQDLATVPQASAPSPPTAADQARQPLSQLDEKTRQLAEFFNGEVVEIDEPLDEIAGADAA
jgi:DNA polymerase-3 subunit gamma/tau